MSRASEKAGGSFRTDDQRRFTYLKALYPAWDLVQLRRRKSTDPLMQIKSVGVCQDTDVSGYRMRPLHAPPDVVRAKPIHAVIPNALTPNWRTSTHLLIFRVSVSSAAPGTSPGNAGGIGQCMETPRLRHKGNVGMERGTGNLAKSANRPGTGRGALPYIQILLQTPSSSSISIQVCVQPFAPSEAALAAPPAFIPASSTLRIMVQQCCDSGDPAHCIAQ